MITDNRYCTKKLFHTNYIKEAICTYASLHASEQWQTMEFVNHCMYNSGIWLGYFKYMLIYCTQEYLVACSLHCTVYTTLLEIVVVTPFSLGDILLK